MQSSILQDTAKKVSFATTLETVHFVERWVVVDDRDTTKGDTESETIGPWHRPSQLTEELTVLSSEHGRARRHLRNIEKIDVQATIRHGVKTRARPDRNTGASTISIYLSKYSRHYGRNLSKGNHVVPTSRHYCSCILDMRHVESSLRGGTNHP